MYCFFPTRDPLCGIQKQLLYKSQQTAPIHICKEPPPQNKRLTRIMVVGWEYTFRRVVMYQIVTLPFE